MDLLVKQFKHVNISSNINKSQAELYQFIAEQPRVQFKQIGTTKFFVFDEYVCHRREGGGIAVIGFIGRMPESKEPMSDEPSALARYIVEKVPGLTGNVNVQKIEDSINTYFQNYGEEKFKGSEIHQNMLPSTMESCLNVLLADENQDLRFYFRLGKCYFTVITTDLKS